MSSIAMRNHSDNDVNDNDGNENYNDDYNDNGNDNDNKNVSIVNILKCTENIMFQKYKNCDCDDYNYNDHDQTYCKVLKNHNNNFHSTHATNKMLHTNRNSRINSIKAHLKSVILRLPFA